MQPLPLAVQSFSVADQLAPIARVRAKLVTGCFDNPGAGAASLNPISMQSILSCAPKRAGGCNRCTTLLLRSWPRGLPPLLPLAIGDAEEMASCMVVFAL